MEEIPDEIKYSSYYTNRLNDFSFCIFYDNDWTDTDIRESDSANGIEIWASSSLIDEVVESVWHYEGPGSLHFWLDPEGKTIYKLEYDDVSGWDNSWYLYKLELKPIEEENEDSLGVETRKETYKSSSKILQSTVATMYKNLRTLAIVALLTILVYVGIRIVISSASKDKAKYKQMLMDWLVAFIMLFVLHYIMAFTIDISEKLTDVCNESNIENLPIKIPDGTRLKDDETGDYSVRLDDGDEGSDVWGTNFIGAIRFYAGLVQKRGYTMKGIMYTIMYIVLVIYTVMFTFQYMRRVLYMSFLTMIAPLVAITYPLDKLSDGKAQGFNLWLKEYIFNALLQPIHFILYVVIMGSVMDLVVLYPVYALVALGFMIPAEKFIRKMFGFEKAGTVSAFGGAAGAAMLMSGIQKLTYRPNKKKEDKTGGKEDKQNKSNTKIREISAIDNPPSLGGGTPGGGTPGGGTPGGETPGGGTPGGETPGGGTPGGETPGGETPGGGTPGEGTPGEGTPSGTKGSLWNGVKAIGGNYTRRMNNSLKGFKPIRSLRRAATYGIGAAALGAVGLAAGIASGDPSKAFQYTMAGGAVGGNLGRNLGDTASNIADLEGTRNAFMAGALGADGYGELQRANAHREFKGNASNYQTALREVGADEWKEMTQDGGLVDEALEYGVNDIEAICKIRKYEKAHGNDRNKAFQTYKLANQFGDISSNSKTRENLIKILRLKGYSDEDSERTAEEMAKRIKEFKSL